MKSKALELSFILISRGPTRLLGRGQLMYGKCEETKHDKKLAVKVENEDWQEKSLCENENSTLYFYLWQIWCQT